MRLRKLAVSTVSALLATSAAHAQFPQYINPGSGALTKPDERATVEKGMGDALWRLGGLRIQPVLGVRDIGYVSNINGTPGKAVDDFTATGVIGLKAYLPIGKKVILAGHFLPEYVWWLDTKALETWQYRYGAGLFGYFNRLTMAAKFTAEDQQQYVSNEIDTPANVTNDKVQLDFAVRVSGAISIFFGGSQDTSEYDDNGLGRFFPSAVENLDRRESVVRGGVSYERANGFQVGLGYESAKTDFTHTSRDRSNSGGGPILIIHHNGSRWTADGDVAYRRLKQQDGALFHEFESFSGHARLGLRVGARTHVDVYGSEGLFYTLLNGTDYADEQRLGISGTIQLGWRTDLRAYYEFGEATYRSSIDVLDERRIDDFDTAGIEAQFRLGESATIRLGYNHTVFDSNFNVFDRKLDNIQFSLNFGGIGNAW